jgi:hypothetical protein
MSRRGRRGVDDEGEPRDSQGFQVRTFRLPSRNEKNWHKKDRGAPPPDWAKDVLCIMSIAANWYGPKWCVPGTEGWRRFEGLLEAIRQHLYNGKCLDKPPKNDPRRREWESRRARCRVEWQRLREWSQAFADRVAKFERDTGTRRELMTPEEGRDFFLAVMRAHNKPGRIPTAILVSPQEGQVFQARFDGMMSGKKPLDAVELLMTPHESEIQLLRERLTEPQDRAQAYTVTATVIRTGH